jgi:putative NIF3 family GTP cyclohydrolase 1 type 2
MQLTVADIASRLSQQFGPAWGMADGLSFGALEAPVTGIAVTWTPTMEVLKRAAAKQQNLILSIEPPFWNGKAPEGRSPGKAELEADPTYQLKSAFMERNRLNVLYVRDGWTQRSEDGQLRGLARALGWERYYRPKAQSAAWAHGNNGFVLPTPSFGELAGSIKKQLKAHAIRCIGNPQIPVTNVALTHGYFLVSDLEKVLLDTEVDVVVCGEVCEWEAAPYFMDLIASGQKRGMILLGSQVSSEPGCGELATWAHSFISEVPIEWHPAGEPFQAVG